MCTATGRALRTALAEILGNLAGFLDAASSRGRPVLSVRPVAAHMGKPATREPAEENVHGYGPCSQDVSASAPYAVVSPYVLSVRPVAAHMGKPAPGGGC